MRDRQVQSGSIGVQSNGGFRRAGAGVTRVTRKCMHELRLPDCKARLGLYSVGRVLGVDGDGMSTSTMQGPEQGPEQSPDSTND